MSELPTLVPRSRNKDPGIHARQYYRVATIPNTGNLLSQTRTISPTELLREHLEKCLEGSCRRQAVVRRERTVARAQEEHLEVGEKV